jgi:hypothetical protein
MVLGIADQCGAAAIGAHRFVFGNSLGESVVGSLAVNVRSQAAEHRLGRVAAENDDVVDRGHIR